MLMIAGGEPGSLTIGGYDTARFFNSTSTPWMSMDSNSTRRFTLGLSKLQISFDQNRGAQNTTVSGEQMSFPSQPVVIDTFTPYIWMPPDICAIFERALGLNWDETNELYLISEALHQTLNKTNPKITFQLGDLIASNDNTFVSRQRNFSMSYSSFDLSASAPLVSTPNPTRYFPLKRIPSTRLNQSWVLGRAFLQDTYLIARYDQHTFSLSQARFDKSISSQIQTIDLPSGSKPSYIGQMGDGDHSKTKLIIIFVCTISGLIALAGCILYYCIWAYRNGKRPFSQAHRRQQSESESSSARPLGSTDVELSAEKPLSESSSREIFESGGSPSSLGELGGSCCNPKELLGDLAQVYEMDAGSPTSKRRTSSLRSIVVAV
jgi:hypothetical protein